MKSHRLCLRLGIHHRNNPTSFRIAPSDTRISPALNNHVREQGHFLWGSWFTNPWEIGMKSDRTWFDCRHLQSTDEEQSAPWTWRNKSNIRHSENGINPQLRSHGWILCCPVVPATQGVEFIRHLDGPYTAARPKKWNEPAVPTSRFWILSSKTKNPFYWIQDLDGSIFGNHYGDESIVFPMSSLILSKSISKVKWREHLGRLKVTW